MKQRTLFLMLAVLIGMVSCSKESADIDNIDNQSKAIVVSISGIDPIATKSLTPASPVDVLNDGALAYITSVDVYVTDASGIILRSARISTSDAAWTNLIGAGYKFVNVESTASRVYVFGNLGAAMLTPQGTNISMVNTTKNLYQVIGTQTILYMGNDNSMTPMTEPVGPDQTIGTTYQAQVTLTPIVSRFQITGITFQESANITVSKNIGGNVQTANVAWTGFTADLLGVYMNNFFYTNTNRIPGDLKSNVANASSFITQGTWLFDITDYANVAAYCNYNTETSSYTPLALPQSQANKCYAFNFFPENLGSTIPKLHLQLTNIQTATLTSSDDNVFNPQLLPDQSAMGYINVIKFYKQEGSNLVEMTGADFLPNKLYNLEINVTPVVIQTDLQQTQFNVWIIVTVQPWSAQTIIPGIESN